MKTYSSSAAGSKKMKVMKMRGFMCQTQLGSVVCMNENPRSSSVIVPRKASRLMIEHAKLISKNQSSEASSSAAAVNYMKLIESPNLNITTSKRRTPPAIDQVNSCPKAQTRSIASILATKESAEDTVFQVVALRVSIHCQGCAGKVKKHLSKMEGVTSFSIDIETKRVIVMGNVSPDWVLESLSKVKKAEFWPV